MEKLIGCVDHHNGHITSLRVFEPDTDSWKDMPRQDVVREIQSRLHTYRTWYKEPRSQQWEKGPIVQTIPISGNWYLRTDDNQLAADNLGSLPSLAVCPWAPGKSKR
jgi:hypothetical protein